ncbi:MAG TPA: hypothetical protein VGC66_14065 [Pyrinomonadaceae bacterium]
MKRVAILLSVLIAVAPCTLQAQTTASSGQETSKKRTSVSTQTTTVSDGLRQASLKIEEGDRITLRNRFGPIVVTGIGGDTLEATATELKQGTGGYKVHLIASRSGEKIMIAAAVTTPGQAQNEKEDKATVTARGSGASVVAAAPKSAQQPAPKPAQPTPSPRPAQAVGKGTGTGTGQGTGTGIGIGRTPRPPRPPRPPVMATPSAEALRGVTDIKLEVKLPRNAHIDLIDSRRYASGTTASGAPSYLTNTRNDVSVTNIDTPVSIISSGDVQAAKVGAVEVKTRAGNVQVKDIEGPVSITTVTGAIIARDANGDVRAVSISGTISIECARGRTEATTTDGIITLTGIGGDLDATTTGGTISFTGAIREGGRYRLKSMSGLVRMLIQKEPPGFVASLSSYKGQIQQDFEMKTELSANTATSDLPQTQGQPVRRMMGRYGDGNARITLDSFSGTVQLGRAPSQVWKKCQ